MAFIGIRILPEIGRSLAGVKVPGNKEDSSEYHITILCFEKDWAISEIAKAMEATYNVVSKIKPFKVKTNSVKSFPKREGEDVAVVAEIESPALHKLNEKLKKEFDKTDVSYSKLFKDYNPHITLSYADKEIKKFDIDEVEFTVQEIVLWGGDHGDDRIFITFPLNDPKKLSKSLLIQKADIFLKLANNPPQDYLTASYERRINRR